LTPPLFRPAAAADVEEASRWYEAQRPGLGRTFLEAVEAALGNITANPKAFTPVYRDRRRALLRGFPYGLVYRIVDDQIVILACIHAKRNPRVWKARQ
jgi:plasmid stabilization system protein ParE